MPQVKTVLYCHLHNIDKVGIGIKQKIYSQIEGIKELGYNVSFLTGTLGGISLDGVKVKVSKNSIISRILNPIFADKLLNNQKYDIIYVRGFGIDPSLLLFLRQLKKRGSYVIYEFPTYPYDKELEHGGVVKKLYSFIDKTCKNFLKKYVDLTINFSNYNSILGIRSVSIQNCVDVNKVKFTGFQEFNKRNQCVNLIGVAGLANYHAFDRLIKGMISYYDSKVEYDVHFHIVGYGQPTYDSLVHLVDQSKGLKSHITFHGKQTGSALTEIFSQSSIAIGSLGMHRISLTDGSVLKVREYFARGIPFIIAYNDLGIEQHSKYYFKAMADESPIDIMSLLNWYRGIKFSGEEMRSIAEKEFNWKNQFKKIFDEVDRK